MEENKNKKEMQEQELCTFRKRILENDSKGVVNNLTIITNMMISQNESYQRKIKNFITKNYADGKRYMFITYDSKRITVIKINRIEYESNRHMIIHGEEIVLYANDNLAIKVAIDEKFFINSVPLDSKCIKERNSACGFITDFEYGTIKKFTEYSGDELADAHKKLINSLLLSKSDEYDEIEKEYIEYMQNIALKYEIALDVLKGKVSEEIIGSEPIGKCCRITRRYLYRDDSIDKVIIGKGITDVKFSGNDELIVSFARGKKKYVMKGYIDDSQSEVCDADYYILDEYCTFEYISNEEYNNLEKDFSKLKERKCSFCSPGESMSNNNFLIID